MIRVGTAGWSYPDWKGVVYPTPMPRGTNQLSYLSKFMDCVEINASFYAIPRRQNVERWADCVRTLPGFLFTVKLLKAFTHDAPLRTEEWDRRAEAWLDAVEPLRAEGRLLALLVQFPASFREGAAQWRRLDRIRSSFGHLPIVLELRHVSWFASATLRTLEGMGVSLARIDLPASPLHPPNEAPTFGPVGYLRLHGRNTETWFRQGVGRDARYDYLYAPKEVRELAQTARRIASGADETVVVTNNHFSGKAVVNALELLADLHETKPLAPAQLVDAYPHLQSLVSVQGQRDLF